MRALNHSFFQAGDGKPRARFLFDDDIPPVTYDNYLKRVDGRSDKAVLLTANKNHVPLIKYVIDDVSLEFHLYGGSDFGIILCCLLSK